jgi:Transposase/zinc-finger of transposase IS204/IS1001/IS1096/IS1165
MQSVTLSGGVVYHHVRPTPAGPVRCPACGNGREALGEPTVAFHSWRRRTVAHLGIEEPTYLVLQVPKYACHAPDCPRKYFTPPVAEAAPRARTSRRLQQTAVRRYRRGTAALRAVAQEVREDFHTGTGKSSVLRWHRATLATDCPRPARLPFSSVLCIDEVYDHVGGRRVPTWTCVDPLADITIRIPIERADATGLAAAMQQVKALGAAPKVIVSDLWAAYPAALAQVWPQAERQLCWFHVMQWVTRKLAELLKQVGDTWPERERKALRRLRCRFLAGPETLAAQTRAGRLSRRDAAALAGLWAFLRGTVVEEALQLRDDLRAIVTTSTTRREARARFDALRHTWPEPFRPPRSRLDGWRPGQPLPPKPAPPAPPPPRATDDALEHFLEEIRTFFVAHFEAMITYLDHPGVPRTNNHAERANRRYRAASRPRYGWKTAAGHRAMLVALQGFDTS